MTSDQTQTYFAVSNLPVRFSSFCHFTTTYLHVAAVLMSRSASPHWIFW